jgi:type VI secretion system protein ImpK
MSDDPFAEPSDAEATVIRPRPGGQAGARAAAPPPPPAPAPLPTAGANPLIAAAAPVLAAAVRLGTPRHPDPERLKRGMVEAIRGFEQRALATGLDGRSLRAARYALCATIDDLVLNTPWGGASSWTAQSLTSLFHNEVSGGERFFEILEQMQKDLVRHAEVVELMYLCLALGFEGRYRVLPRGSAALAELREGLYRAIRARRGEPERELSPHWRGLSAAYTPLAGRVPIWVLATATLGVACLIYIGFNFALAGASDMARAALAALPPQETVTVPRPAPAPPPPAAPVVAALAPKLRGFLAPEIKAGLVEVFENPQATTIRLTNRDMFASGSATLNSAALPLLGRIAGALNDEAGAIAVNGYTDNQPIHTVQFPSNWQLSQARAEAVAKVLAAHLTDPARVRAVGRGDADPVAPNTTPEGRQANRRTEIVLTRTASVP